MSVARLSLLLAGVAWGCALAPAPGLASQRHEAPITATALADLLGRLPADRSLLAPGHAAAQVMIRDELEALGLSVERLPFDWAGAPEADLANLELRFPGPVPDAPLLLVSAHYDTVPGTPGADDNGSGTVALLELARRLAGHRLEAELRLLWFDAEETGLIGSGAYLRELSAEEASRLIGLINLETIGYTDPRPGSQRMPPGSRALFDPGDRGDFLLILGNLGSAGLAQAVSRAMQPEHGESFRSATFALLPGAGWLFPDTRRSDHAHFWDAGLPAVMLTDTANLRSPHYHTPGDRIETLDLPFLAAGVRGVERAILLLAGTGPATG
jgi:hypothetical protein